MTFFERLRALGWFLVASAWFMFSDVIAARAASGLTFGSFYEPLYRIFLLFLLLFGYSVMSRFTDRNMPAPKALGLDARPGWWREWALGSAIGWGAVVACVLPTALIGGLIVTIFTNSHQVVTAVFDLIAMLAGTLALELTFRGYAFRQLVVAMGPAMGTFFMAVIFCIWRTHTAPVTTAIVVVSFLLGWALALAALRTQAIWVSWGLHFAWIAVMSLLFGLPVAGPMNESPIFVTNASGPAWITGSTQGPEGSAFAVIIGVLLLIVVFRVTDELHHRYGHPEIVPGGIPVDIEAASRRQHESAMASAAPQAPPLVQIASAPPSSPQVVIPPAAELHRPGTAPEPTPPPQKPPLDADQPLSESAIASEDSTSPPPSGEEPPGPEAT